MCHVSCVMCHMSRVTCHRSHVFFFFLFSLNKMGPSGWASLVEALLSKGPTPFSFFSYLFDKISETVWIIYLITILLFTTAHINGLKFLVKLVFLWKLNIFNMLFKKPYLGGWSFWEIMKQNLCKSAFKLLFSKNLMQISLISMLIEEYHIIFSTS